MSFLLVQSDHNERPLVRMTGIVDFHRVGTSKSTYLSFHQVFRKSN